jgi:hypothetical protein
MLVKRRLLQTSFIPHTRLKLQLGREGLDYLRKRNTQTQAEFKKCINRNCDLFWTLAKEKPEEDLNLNRTLSRVKKFIISCKTVRKGKLVKRKLIFPFLPMLQSLTGFRCKPFLPTYRLSTLIEHRTVLKYEKQP